MGATLSIEIGAAMGVMGMALLGLGAGGSVEGVEDAHFPPRRRSCHRRWQGRLLRRRK